MKTFLFLFSVLFLSIVSCSSKNNFERELNSEYKEFCSQEKTQKLNIVRKDRETFKKVLFRQNIGLDESALIAADEYADKNGIFPFPLGVSPIEYERQYYSKRLQAAA